MSDDLRADTDVKLVITRGSWQVEIHWCQDFVEESEDGAGWIWVLQTEFAEWIVAGDSARSLRAAHRAAMVALRAAARGEYDDALARTKAKTYRNLGDNTEPVRLDHIDRLRVARNLAQRALYSAESRGYRLDCLREAARCLEGAHRAAEFDACESREGK